MTYSLETETQDPHEAEPLSTSREDLASDLLRLYIGPNAIKFLSITKGLKETNYKKSRSFNVAAFFFPLAWFFYRKIYFEGLFVALFIPIIVSLIFPDLPSILYTSLHIAIGMYANRYYLESASKKVDQIIASGLSERELRKKVKKRGGVSEIGAVLGVLLTASIIATSFMNLSTNKLPTCQHPETHKLVKNLIVQNSDGALTKDAINISESQTIKSSEGQEHICRFKVSQGSKMNTFRGRVYWHDQLNGKFGLQLAIDQD